MKSGMQALVYSVRLTVVLKFFGQLNFGLPRSRWFPWRFPLFQATTPSASDIWPLSVFFFFIGNGFSRFRAPRRIQTNEAMVVTAIAFFFGPLVMSYPMMGAGLAFTDAFFRSRLSRHNNRSECPCNS